MHIKDIIKHLIVRHRTHSALGKKEYYIPTSLKKRKRKTAPHVPGKSPSPVLMWPATA